MRLHEPLCVPVVARHAPPREDRQVTPVFGFWEEEDEEEEEEEDDDDDDDDDDEGKHTSSRRQRSGLR